MNEWKIRLTYLFCHSQLFGSLNYKVNAYKKDLLYQVNRQLKKHDKKYLSLIRCNSLLKKGPLKVFSLLENEEIKDSLVLSKSSVKMTVLSPLDLI